MGRVNWGIETGGTEIGVIDIGVNEIGVIDIGVNVIDGMEGSVTEIGVYVKDGIVGTGPSESNAVQLKSTQQPWTPLMMTQLRPRAQ